MSRGETRTGRETFVSGQKPAGRETDKKTAADLKGCLSGKPDDGNKKATDKRGAVNFGK